MNVCDLCLEAIEEEMETDTDDEEGIAQARALAIIMGADIPDHDCEAIENREVVCFCGCHRAAKTAINQSMRRMG